MLSRSLIFLSLFILFSCSVVVEERFRIEVKDDKGNKLTDGVFCYISNKAGAWSKLPIKNSVVIDSKMNMNSLLCKKCGFSQVKVTCDNVGKDCGRYNRDDYDDGKNYIQINPIPRSLSRRVNYPNKNNNYEYWDRCLVERDCIVIMKKNQ